MQVVLEQEVLEGGAARQRFEIASRHRPPAVFASAGSIAFAGPASGGRKPPGGKRERDTPPGHVTGGREFWSAIYLLRTAMAPTALRQSAWKA